MSRFAAFDTNEYCKVWHVSQALLQLLLWDLSPLPFAGFVASARICRNRLSQDLLQLPLTGFLVITFCRTCCDCRLQDSLHGAGFIAAAHCRIRCVLKNRLQLNTAGFVAVQFCKLCCMLEDWVQLHISGLIAFGRACCNCTLQDFLQFVSQD